MRRLKAVALMAIALFAFAAFTATSAFAADENSPSILLLEGKSSKKGSQLEGKFTGGESFFTTLSGKSIVATGASATLSGCESINGHEFDTNFCKDAVLTFTGWKKEKVACRSETKAGEKDAVETVLEDLDIRVGSEESLEEGKTMELQPLLVMTVLSAALEPIVFLNCGGVKEELKGNLGCLLMPGLKNLLTSEKARIVCATKAGDPVTGHCEQECKLLETEPFSANVGTGKFEDAWENITLEGAFNEHIFIDD